MNEPRAAEPDRKLFGVGLSRTGTTSLAKALQILGYTALHYPALPDDELFDEVPLGSLEPFDAVVDTPIPAIFERLDRLYAGSRFIHTVRPLDPWLDSCERFFTLKDSSPDLSREERSRACKYRRLVYGTETFDRRLFAQAYLRHEARLADYFGGRPEKLLVLDVFGKDPWSELCGFLGLDTRPGTPFPHENSLEPHPEAPES